MPIHPEDALAGRPYVSRPCGPMMPSSPACRPTDQNGPSAAALSHTVRQNVPSATSSLMNLDPASSSSSNPKSATDNASGIWDSYHSQKTRTPAGEERKDLVASQLGIKNLSENFQRQMPRRWQDGEVYAPHDLSEVEARKWKKVTNVQRDLVDMLGLRPVDMYSVSLLSVLKATNLSVARQACRLRAKGFAQAGLPDPTRYAGAPAR